MSLLTDPKVIEALSFPRVSGDEPEPPSFSRSPLRFSRVSGDEPEQEMTDEHAQVFSPREWG